MLPEACTPASRTRFLRRGDIVVAINGERVESVKHLAQLANLDVYQWRVSIKRKGRLLKVVIGG